MSDYVIVEGSNIRDAIEKALEKLNCSRDEVNYQVLEHRASGFLGLGEKHVKLKVWKKLHIKEREEQEEVEKNREKLAEAEAISEKLDGYFTIDYRSDGVFLKIVPPKGDGAEVAFDDIKSYIVNKHIKDVDFNKVREAVEENFYEEIKIAEAQEEYKEDAKFEVEITKDKMKAYGILIPPAGGGKWLNEDEALSIIKEKGIVHGVKIDVVNRLIQKKQCNERFLIAEGDYPVHGKDAEIKFYFERNKKNVPVLLEDGRVDFRNLNLIENVTKGKLLASKIPVEKGVPGKNVFGEEIPPKEGRDFNLPVGKNVEVSEDGLNCFAGIDGQVLYIGGKINVYPVFEVAGDVDTSTGNIDFLGSVIVRGSVREGFKVKAEGDVEVYGTVEGAEIIAGGNIVLYRGIQGRDKGLLRAQGNIFAKYIEHSKIEAKGDVVAGDAIMHSIVNAGKRVEVGGKKGLIVGGIVRAGDEISAKTIGSSMATTTIIEVGINPIIKQNYLKTKEKLDRLEKDYIKTKQAVELLKKLESVGKLTHDKKYMLEKLYNTLNHLEKQLELSKKEIDIMREEVDEIDKGRVKALNKIFPGVSVTIGSATMKVRDDLVNVLLFKADEQIKIGSCV